MNAAILNSLQSRTPSATDKWIDRTRAAVECLAQSGAAIVSSTGLNTYEFVLWYAGSLGIRQTVVVPNRESPQEILEDFELNPAATDFIVFDGKPTERDGFVAAKADILYPVSVKPGGISTGPFATPVNPSTAISGSITNPRKPLRRSTLPAFRATNSKAGTTSLTGRERFTAHSPTNGAQTITARYCAHVIDTDTTRSARLRTYSVRTRSSRAT
jgi:hypothetical protein